jgi:micrococcal nuclease
VNFIFIGGSKNYLLLPQKLITMKKLLSTILFAVMGLFASAQQQIKIEDAAQHEGDSVTICSKVYGGRYMENSKSAITLLNVGDLYPNALLTILIKPENRAAFTNKPEEFYIGKEVCITGKIIMFKGKPEIELFSEKGISISPKP